MIPRLFTLTLALLLACDAGDEHEHDPTTSTTNDPSNATDEPTSGATDSSATMPGGTNCADNDGDGYGDPEMCMDQPSPGSVPNNEDCADDNKDAFPGSAENESGEAQQPKP